MSNIRKQRQIKGLTQLELADQLGLTQASVSYWERKNVVPEEYATKIAEILGCEESDLFAEEEPESLSAILSRIESDLQHARRLERETRAALRKYAA